MATNAYLLAFAIAFMGCVFATPLVTRLATWAGAIDRPDQFRRIHRGAIPRLGGLGLAFGLLVSVVPVVAGGYVGDLAGVAELWAWWAEQWPALVAGEIGLAGG